MKILFDNIIDDAIITSVNGSLNYPPENLQDPVLSKRFQSSTDNDIITIDFEDSSNINCFHYAFTTATLMQVRFYIGSDSLVYSFNITSPLDQDAYHFNTIVADYAEVTIVGSLGVYLGGVGTGQDIEFPNPDGAWREPKQDNSIQSEGRNSQTLTDYIKPLRLYNWIFKDVQRDDINTYVALYENIGIGAPIWVDPFEEDHEFIAPLYCKITKPMSPGKNGRVYQLNLDLKEAR